MLTPAFRYDILKAYVGIMADSVRVMLVSPSLDRTAKDKDVRK